METIATPLHETLTLKYPRSCEKCKTVMSPQYVKVVHSNMGENILGTIHYVCDKCGIEFDLPLNGEDGSNVTIDPKMGVIL
jgi:RNase P subunit RPR2